MSFVINPMDYAAEPEPLYMPLVVQNTLQPPGSPFPNRESPFPSRPHSPCLSHSNSIHSVHSHSSSLPGTPFILPRRLYLYGIIDCYHTIGEKQESVEFNDSEIDADEEQLNDKSLPTHVFLQHHPSFREESMENSLHRRDRAGVQDFVLLEDYQSERAFVDNLRKRFRENLIYTYIGPVLVSMNPYKNLDIYNDEYLQQYRNSSFYELPPHIFAIADAAYNLLHEEWKDQCILISGESGTGKTEASKKILQYIAAASHHSSAVERVKNKLLQSNPVLEAFGNAKTNRNDNSSRFGKYMDVEFDQLGAPIGGHIRNYLLEKSRVVQQCVGERNFHIFYQLIQGGDDALLDRLSLRRDSNYYFYLNQGDSTPLGGVDDLEQFQSVHNAFKTIDFTPEEEECVYEIVASVLHLGNTGFMEDNSESYIAYDKPVIATAKLLGCTEDILRQALTTRSIEARGENVRSPLSRDQAIYARDALAKAIYERLFKWLVSKLNASLKAHDFKGRKTVMGLLDIYGFEVFKRNSFEQFCINYCNEKLQQLFIELTLRSEQEEYLREGIEWTPIEYFDNKVICDLVEERHKGIISLLDEECLRPGGATDRTFLAKMESTIRQHPHFVTHQLANNKIKKSILRDEFRLLHYAGEVTYKIDGFLDKNNDLLYRDLKRAMAGSSNLVVRQTFPHEELLSKKRPPTAATQFKNSLQELMVILMSKEPWYIRCIKPNDSKQPIKFDEKIVLHQVKYLGLIENLRVRRAGFCYRRSYELFLRRYKSLCPDTWPKYEGDARSGVELLVNYLDYKPEEFAMGKTKIFIRFPRTLFETEDAFQFRKHHLASMIQAQFRCYVAQKRYQRMRNAAILIECTWRRYQAQRLLEKRRQAVAAIRRFIKGFMTRNEPENEINQRFVRQVRAEYLQRLANNLPKNLLDKTWLSPPEVCKEASDILRGLHRSWLVRRYVRSITPQRRKLLQWKVEAEALFKGKKDSYLSTIPVPFVENRLSPEQELARQTVFEKSVKHHDEKTMYSLPVTKYDRHGYKARNRVIILTNAALYLVDAKDFKAKHRLPYKTIAGVSVSSFSDGLLVLRIPRDQMKKEKGDLIVDAEQHIIEFLSKLALVTGQRSLITVEQNNSVCHTLSNGKQGVIDFARGASPLIQKTKNGHLNVSASNDDSCREFISA